MLNICSAHYVVVFLRSSTLLVGWQEGHPVTAHPAIFIKFLTHCVLWSTQPRTLCSAGTEYQLTELVPGVVDLGDGRVNWKK